MSFHSIPPLKDKVGKDNDRASSSAPKADEPKKDEPAGGEWYLGEVSIGDAKKIGAGTADAAPASPTPAFFDTDVSQRLRDREKWFKPSPKDEPTPKCNPWADKGE